MEATNSYITVEVVKGRNFSKGVKYAKRFGGRFDPQTKTWQIPADRPEIGNLAAYYLRQVGRVDVPTVEGCIHYTADQGCPLHGEYCLEVW